VTGEAVSIACQFRTAEGVPVSPPAPARWSRSNANPQRLP